MNKLNQSAPKGTAGPEAEPPEARREAAEHRQRKLLGKARLKLREIPAGTVGMICIQTVSASAFLSDIHDLIDQAQFSRIPIVWLNPSLRPGTNSKIVFRDEARELVDRLFW